MKNFKELHIWQNGIEIAKQACFLVDKLFDTEKFGLRSQESRALVSIPTNMAAGSSSENHQDYL